MKKLGLLLVMVGMLNPTHADIFEAIENGDLSSVQECINNGADVNNKSNVGLTALMWASRYGQIKIVEYLIKNGADIKNKDNKTALDIAKKEKKVAEYLESL